MKIKPPKLGGKKVGIFASRAPHRPNPIGLSIAKVEKVEGNALYVSGVDLVDGTPILDIKPYIPQWDAVPDACAPSWVTDPPVPPITEIEFSVKAEVSLQALAGELVYLKGGEGPGSVKEGIREALGCDPRSTALRNKYGSKVEFGFCIDSLNVICQMIDERHAALVLDVELNAERKAREAM